MDAGGPASDGDAEAEHLAKLEAWSATQLKAMVVMHGMCTGRGGALNKYRGG
jgi:hypothetical protein